MMPEPPEDLGPAAQALWRSAYASVVAAGIWRPAFVVGLEYFARSIEAYVALAQIVSADDPGVQAMHRNVRASLHNWHLVGARYPAPLRSDGIDADVARICGLSSGGNA